MIKCSIFLHKEYDMFNILDRPRRSLSGRRCKNSKDHRKPYHQGVLIRYAPRDQLEGASIQRYKVVLPMSHAYGIPGRDGDS